MAKISSVLSHLLHYDILALAILVYQRLSKIVVRMSAKDNVYPGGLCNQPFVVVFVLYFPSKMRNAHNGIATGLFQFGDALACGLNG